jgi:copper(I)-binding protein
MKDMQQTTTFPVTRRARRLAGTALAVGALALFTVACGEDEDTADTTAAPTTDAAADTTAAETTAVETTAAETVPAETEILIEGAWARNSPMNVDKGAAYMTITSPVDDKLLSASVDASISTTVEIHEMVPVDAATETTMGMGTETTMGMGMGHGNGQGQGMGSGELKMQKVEFIALPAGEAVALKPGGYHIMFIGLVAPLELGTTITLTLVFENAGEITVDVPVLEEAP